MVDDRDGSVRLSGIPRHITSGFHHDTVGLRLNLMMDAIPVKVQYLAAFAFSFGAIVLSLPSQALPPSILPARVEIAQSDPPAMPTPSESSQPTPSESSQPLGDPSPTPGMSPSPQPAAEQPTGNIVELASANPELSTLVTAVKAAGLVETLSGNNRLTVFAPSNQAFSKLPPATLQRLLRPANRAKLRKLLTYHVVAGEKPAQSLRSGRLPSVQGGAINVRVAGGKVKVNNANVVIADVRASNGIVHVIDRVILPPGF
jgi:uncharacterized surface protein with fasciclin (FAS1) repeats